MPSLTGIFKLGMRADILLSDAIELESVAFERAGASHLGDDSEKAMEEDSEVLVVVSLVDWRSMSE